jgi:hypothetical protein
VSSRATLLRKQLAWADRFSVPADDKGYVGSVSANLWRPLSPETQSAFDRGRGGELRDAAQRPAKLKSLISSAALAINVFDYWTAREAASLATALGIGVDGVTLQFEAQFPTALRRNPPNLDVVLRLGCGTTLAIESKFSEWLTPISPRTGAFRQAYFPTGGGLWNAQGLAACQSLACDLYQGTERFRYLHAPQLLKHVLGLATQAPRRFSLTYLYYDVSGAKSALHVAEIERFRTRVGAEIRFQALTYQELFARLSSMDDIDPSYLNYLNARYFG